MCSFNRKTETSLWWFVSIRSPSKLRDNEMVFFPCPFFDGLDLVKPWRPTGTSDLHPQFHFISKVFFELNRKITKKQKSQVQIPSSLHLPCPYMYIIHVYTYVYLFISIHIQSILMYIYILAVLKRYLQNSPKPRGIWVSVRCRCSIEGSHVKVEGQIRRLTFTKRRG